MGFIKAKCRQCWEPLDSCVCHKPRVNPSETVIQYMDELKAEVEKLRTEVKKLKRKK